MKIHAAALHAYVETIQNTNHGKKNSKTLVHTSNSNIKFYSVRNNIVCLMAKNSLIDHQFQYAQY